MRAGSFGARYGGTALITGASAGIGAAFAGRLARDGTDLVLVARRAERLEALARELMNRHGIRAEVLPADLVAPGAVERLVQELAARGLDVGILVHNAGFGTGSRFHTEDPARLLAMVDLHCRIPVELTRALVPAMVARGQGAVIVVASVAAYVASPIGPLYGATKAFDLHFAEGLSGQLRPFGVDVLAVSPGYTRTEFHAAADLDRSAIPGFAWSSAEAVAETALARLGRDPSVVVDRKWRAVAALIRLLPRGVVNRLVAPAFFRKVAHRDADDGRRQAGTTVPPREDAR